VPQRSRVLAITPARAAAEAPSRASLGNSSSTSMSWSSTSMGAAWSERGALCGPADDEPGSYGDDPAVPEHGALGAAWSEHGALCGAADEPSSCGGDPVVPERGALSGPDGEGALGAMLWTARQRAETAFSPLQ